jgi:hypothetical protein
MSDISWLDIGITYGDLAQSIKNQDSELIGKHIHCLITTILKISEIYNIDFNDAWDRWKKKALSKKYYSGS